MTRIVWLAPVLAMLVVGCAGRELPEFVQRLPGVRNEQPANEDKIAATLNEIQDGMQHGRVFAVVSHVSEHYKDGAGRDFGSLREYVASLLRTYREIRITRAGTRIAVDGDNARVTESFGTVAIPYDVSKHETLNLQGQLTVNLAKEDNEWKVVEWGPLT